MIFFKFLSHRFLIGPLSEEGYSHILMSKLSLNRTQNRLPEYQAFLKELPSPLPLGGLILKLQNRTPY